MKERPIIICTELIPKVLDGSKTKTRRVIKPQPIDRPVQDACDWWHWLDIKGIGYDKHCPYGQVGDRLWCKETWAVHEYYNHRKPIDIPQGVTVECRALPELVRTDGDGHRKIREGERGKWRPSIHMPRWASRIDLEITDIRVERLQEITEQDAIAEGCRLIAAGIQHFELKPTPHFTEPPRPFTRRDHFIGLWDALNEKRGYPWESNPFVWVIEFKRI